MSEERILAVATAITFSDLGAHESAVRNEDHIAIVSEVRGANICVRVFWPDKFIRIREKLRVTTGEIEDELNDGPFATSGLAEEYDADCYFSSRERLVVRSISNEEYTSLRENINDLTDHMLAQPETLLPAMLALFKVETSIKMKTKSNIFLVTRAIFPRQNHEHIYFFDLKGCPSRSQDDGLFLKDGDLNWETEMNFVQEEREDIIACLRDDIHFLQSLNMTNYSLVVAITKRDSSIKAQLPGQPCGPEDTSVDESNQATLKSWHDRELIRANLIPKPRFVDEHPEWEYYFGLSDVLTPFKTKAKIARAFRIALGASKENLSNMPPVDYGERFLEFMESTVFPGFEDSKK